MARQRWRVWILAGLVFIGVLVADRLFWHTGTGEPSHDGAPNWSPDGRKIVFSVERNKQSDLYVMDADGGHREALTATASDEGAPAFSPDGRQIAFETNRDGNFEIYVMDANGQRPERLTDSNADDRSPSWAPDGKAIAFLSDRDRKPESDVYVMDVGGTNVRRLTSAGQHWAPQFSPLGGQLVVQTNRDLHLIDLATGAARQLTGEPANGMSPSWAPDGHRLVFTTTRNGRLELFRMPIDGGLAEPLVSLSTVSAMDPRWSPDGSRIAFVCVPNQGDAHGEQPYGICVWDVAKRQMTRISQ